MKPSENLPSDYSESNSLNISEHQGSYGDKYLGMQQQGLIAPWLRVASEKEHSKIHDS